MIDKIALLLVIIGGLNWGAVGLFGFDAVAWLFGAGFLARLIYVLVCAGALWCIGLLFRDNRHAQD